MISRFFQYHNPKCDCCGLTLPAERDDAAAEEAMRAAGWARRGDRDACQLCLQYETEHGRLPERRRFQIKG